MVRLIGFMNMLPKDKNASISRLRRLAALTAVAVSCSLAGMARPIPAATIYVSPRGNDHNAGTRTAPIRTLTHARDLVRGRNAHMQGDIDVVLEGGVYRLSAPLTLDARDSGTNGHDVIYTAADGQTAVISGGVRVAGWKLTDPARHLWSAPAPAGLTDTRQLYVNGVRALRTRGRLPVTLTETPTGYTASSAVMATWRNPSDIEFVYTGGNSLWTEHSEGLGAWTEPRCPVASISGATITMAEPCWTNSTKRVFLPNGKRTANLVGPASVGRQPEYVENAYELLGTPGQWYFDRSAHRIYYVPRAGEDLKTADVEAPKLQALVTGQGSAASPIHNIVFRGIRFEYATWLDPDTPEGFSEIQANFRLTGPDGYRTQALCGFVPNGTCPFANWTPAPGNVSFRYDHQIRFIRDGFAHLGAEALQLGDGSQSDRVEGCVFTDISANALALGGVDKPEATGADATAGNRILNNYFFDTPVEYHDGVSILVGYAQNTLIAHNLIHHVPYSGISIGWGGWPDKIQKPGVSNTSHDNVIEDNRIDHHLLLLADGGAIYTQGLTGDSLAHGEKVRGNVVTHQYGSGHAIYSDNGSSEMTITGNVVFDTNFDNWGSRHHDYYGDNDGKAYDPIDVEDNTWQQGDPDSSRLNITEKGNRLIGRLGQAPAATLRNAGLEPQYRDLLRERFGAASAPEPPQRVAAAVAPGEAFVAWNPPIFEGSAPVASYTVTSSRGQHLTVSAAQFARLGYVRFRGLQNGESYTFTVTATNAKGTSSPSLPSAAVTPGAAIHVPGAPQRAFAHAGDGMASIHFQAPKDTGGSPVLAYVVTVLPGGRKVTFTGRKELTLDGRHTTFEVIDGLKNGQSYTFAVAAVNAAGAGAATTTAAVTPQARP